MVLATIVGHRDFVDAVPVFAAEDGAPRPVPPAWRGGKEAHFFYCVAFFFEDSVVEFGEFFDGFGGLVGIPSGIGEHFGELRHALAVATRVGAL